MIDLEEVIELVLVPEPVAVPVGDLDGVCVLDVVIEAVLEGVFDGVPD